MARPPQDPQIRIKEILDTAYPLFYEKGYNETAISDITKKMGVAQGTIYYYFKSKEELLEKLIQRDVEGILSKIKAAIAAQDHPKERFQAGLQMLISSLYIDRGLLLEFLNNDRTIHFMDNLARQGKQLMAPLLLEIIQEGNSQNLFQVPHPRAATTMVLYVMDALITAIYDKVDEECLQQQFEIAGRLITEVLGVKGEVITLYKGR